MKTCVYCGKENPEINFCQSCGRSLSDMGKKDEYTDKYVIPLKPEEKSSYNEEKDIDCPECGMVNNKDAPFCKNCGNKFRELKENIYDEKKLLELNEYVTKQKGSQKKVSVIITSVIALIVVSLALLAHRTFKSIEISKHINSAMTDINNGLDILDQQDGGSQIYFDKSLETFEKALKEDKNNSDIYFYRGVVYYYKYMSEEYMEKPDSEKLASYLNSMAENIETSLKINNKLPEGHVYLATCYLEKGDYNKALAEYNKLLSEKDKYKNKSDKKWIDFAEEAKEKINNKDYSGLEPPLLFRY